MRSPSFGKELRLAAATRSIVPRLLCERPEEWRLGPLTVVLAGERDAQLRYARLAVARAAGAEAGAIMVAWHRALATLEARSLAPDDLLPVLAAAYDDLVAAAVAASDRVDLTVLRDRVVAGRRGYSRAQFAWDVARLRREHRLVHESRRLDFGAATGQSATRPSQVVWVEDDAGTGQYYRHFRMVKQEQT